MCDVYVDVVIGQLVKVFWDWDVVIIKLSDLAVDIACIWFGMGMAWYRKEGEVIVRMLRCYLGVNTKHQCKYELGCNVVVSQCEIRR